MALWLKSIKNFMLIYYVQCSVVYTANPTQYKSMFLLELIEICHPQACDSSSRPLLTLKSGLKYTVKITLEWKHLSRWKLNT